MNLGSTGRGPDRKGGKKKTPARKHGVVLKSFLAKGPCPAEGRKGAETMETPCHGSEGLNIVVGGRAFRKKAGRRTPVRGFRKRGRRGEKSGIAKRGWALPGRFVLIKGPVAKKGNKKLRVKKK